MARPRHPLLEKIIRRYRGAAILLLNTLLLFVALNFLVYAAERALRGKNYRLDVVSPELKYPEESLAAVYPDMSRSERKRMNEELWSRPVTYEDYVLFKERPYHGQYVNVSNVGFRQIKNQGPWPPDPANVNIFVFGGSTMFGYGVLDEQTFASYFQEELTRYASRRVCVYNFGTCFYYLTQERILLEQFVSKGIRPDVVVFVDGLNEWFRRDDLPAFRERLQSALNGAAFSQLWADLPLSRFIAKYFTQHALDWAKSRFRRDKSPQSTETSVAASAPSIEVAAIIQQIIDRYQRNKRLVESVCQTFRITPIFVWQPIPNYKYDLRHHLFFYHPGDFVFHAWGYAAMEAASKDVSYGTNFLWCADLQEHETEPLYVDSHHYTGRFNQKFAAAVTQMCLDRGLLSQYGVSAAPR